jgi:hypothetical protein
LGGKGVGVGGMGVAVGGTGLKTWQALNVNASAIRIIAIFFIFL